MKNYLLLFLLSICVIIVVSCSKEDDLEAISYCLDISSNVPITKSSDPEGSEQHIGGNRWNDVPEEPNECVLNAFIRMAIRNHISLTIETDDGRETININNDCEENYASTAYYKVRNYAMNDGIPMYSGNGEPQIDSSGNQVRQKYSGGAMTTSMAVSLAINIGLPVVGRSLIFPSFQALSSYLENCEIDKLKGKSLVCNHTQGHACIFNGIDKKGRIIGLSAGDYEEKYNQKDNGNDGFTLIY